jgi:segregation and condensation protein B
MSDEPADDVEVDEVTEIEEVAEEDASTEEAPAEAEPAPEPVQDVADQLRLVEALLFASAEPMTERSLKHRLPKEADLKSLLQTLQETYAGRGVNLMQVGESWAFRTAPDLTGRLAKEVEVSRKLSRAAIETLAIVAYHQPLTRVEIEEIRGVGLSKGTLDILFEQGWIRPRGRRKTPGRPVTWGTTDAFLDHFGLSSLDDLPGVEELKAAGLLDKRPAIHAYRAGHDDEEPLAEGDDGSELEAEEALEIEETPPTKLESEG